VSEISGPRTIPGDWHDGTIPANVAIDDTAYIESTFSFVEFRSEMVPGVTMGRGASAYFGTMFDVGSQGRVTLGEYALVHGARIICDSTIEIHDYALISWNVLLMDNYRVPRDPDARRHLLERVPVLSDRRLDGNTEPAPIVIGRNAWVGFDVCVLPGVSVGEGSIVGARSVVIEDVPPFTVVAGNPARVIRTLQHQTSDRHD